MVQILKHLPNGPLPVILYFTVPKLSLCRALKDIKENMSMLTYKLLITFITVFVFLFVLKKETF